MTVASSDSGVVELDWDWWSKQKETLDALNSGDYDLVTFRGGYGSGKTVLGARWIIRTALQTPQGHSLVLAPDRQKGGPATYKGFFEQLPGENTVPNEADGDPENSPIVAGYHGTKHRLTLPNGHLIQLGGADRWNRFAGSEFNAIWCDEVSHYENTNLYDLHEMLITRQRTESGPNVTLWTSTGNGYNQFYDVTERQVQPDGQGGEEPLPWRDSLAVVVANSLKNPFLNEKAKMQRQFGGTEREAQALRGGFAAAEGLVYSGFSRNTHVIPAGDVPELVDDSRPPIYGYDAGWDHPRVLVQFRPTHRDQWVATDLYYESEKAFEHLCDPRQERGYVYREELEAEHEPEHIQKFRQAGFQAVKAEKSLDEGIPFVRGLLETDSQGRPGLLVSGECGELVQEFQSYKEEHVGRGGDVPDHALDGARYCLFTHTPERDSGEGSGVSFM